MRIKSGVSLYLCFLLSTCTVTHNNDKISAINVIAILPQFDFSNGKVYGYDTSTVSIFNYKNIVAYKMYYDYHIHSSDTEITQRWIHYFVNNKDEAWGYNYDERKKFVSEKFLVDSFFKNEWIATNFYPIFGKENDLKLTSSYKTKLSDTLKETYFLKSNLYANETATIFFEYSKLSKNNIHSLSKELDSIKKLGLYKVRIENDPMKVNDTFTMAKYILNYEMQKDDTFNKKEILNYIEKFKSEKLK